jgi:hypothetical protein
MAWRDVVAKYHRGDISGYLQASAADAHQSKKQWRRRKNQALSV